jgi:hypothetical protein
MLRSLIDHVIDHAIRQRVVARSMIAGSMIAQTRVSGEVDVGTVGVRAPT